MANVVEEGAAVKEVTMRSITLIEECRWALWWDQNLFFNNSKYLKMLGNNFVRNCLITLSQLNLVFWLNSQEPVHLLVHLSPSFENVTNSLGITFWSMPIACSLNKSNYLLPLWYCSSYCSPLYHIVVNYVIQWAYRNSSFKLIEWSAEILTIHILLQSAHCQKFNSQLQL